MFIEIYEIPKGFFGTFWKGDWCFGFLFTGHFFHPVETFMSPLRMEAFLLLILDKTCMENLLVIASFFG